MKEIDMQSRFWYGIAFRRPTEILAEILVEQPCAYGERKQMGPGREINHRIFWFKGI
jgi:hypothetical protein